MKLTFLGANHEVTGSCTLLEAAGQRYLIDCSPSLWHRVKLTACW